jgi:hypothetical protein
MFFEPEPAAEEPARRRHPDIPPWSAPPALEAGVPLAVARTVARSDNVVVCLPVIRVFSAGCMLEMEIVSRQASMAEDDWWELHMSVHRGFRGFRGSRLPDQLLRLGVRYPDGSKATTLDRHRRELRDDPPEGPLLSWWPSGSGMRGGGEADIGHSQFGLWLWPLPPAGNFEFAVEWPLGGIGLTIAELDGAAIAAAASRPSYYWPGP